MTSQSLRIIAVGDLSFNGRYHPLLRRHGPEHPFRFVLPLWRGADLRLGNLESPITTAAKAFGSKLTLRAAPGAAAALRAAGFDCLTLANNHMMDYGPRGLADTQAALEAAGLVHVGAGKNAAAARAPGVLQHGGLRVGVLAACLVGQNSPLYAGPLSPGVAAFTVDDMEQSIRELRPRVDWLIVQIHWGEEMARLPSARQREAAGRMAGAGADLILGHHPHVLQPFEMIAGTPVFYSLGNCLFSEMYWRGRTSEGSTFLSKLRTHPLSRRTGWAEVVLARGGPAQATFHPARLGRDLTIRPEPTAGRRREWDALCSALRSPDYEDRERREAARGRGRAEWVYASRPLRRRLEMRLFDYGLIPFGVEGD